MEYVLGKNYRTRGGWKAKVIWLCADNTMLVVHKPGTTQEAGSHNSLDGEAVTTFSVNEAPSFGHHPADLVALWQE